MCAQMGKKGEPNSKKILVFVEAALDSRNIAGAWGFAPIQLPGMAHRFKIMVEFIERFVSIK